MQKITFPKGFLWGTATSAHQVEGNNIMNDWWQWEQARGADCSGTACNHYELFEEDFDIARSLNTNIHRFSIEWSRIEPDRDLWNEKEIRHYHKVLDALIDRGIEPMVTLHHFTNPIWIAENGGWEKAETARRFGRYAEKMSEEFAGKVKWWITINEPMVYINASYKQGLWPPQVSNYKRARGVMRNMLRAHLNAYCAIHDSALSKGRTVNVGLAKNFWYFVPCKEHSLMDRFSAYMRNLDYNKLFLDCLIGGAAGLSSLLIGEMPNLKKSLDFIGLNYYVKDYVRWYGLSPSLEKLAGRLCTWECEEDHAAGYERNCVGWLIAPDGIQAGIRFLSRYKLPIIITENGTCANDDSVRARFIRNHLFQVAKAIAEGANVIGYIYWSLLDNFEWHEGFRPRFGLVEVDYKTQKRILRQSAHLYARICKEGILDCEGIQG